MSMDFSSWPREQEMSFVVFEQRASESQKKAWTFSVIAGAIVFVFMVGVYMGVAPEDPHHEKLTKDMNMSNLTSKKAEKAAETPAPAAAPAEAEKPAAEAEAEKPAE